MGFYEATTHPQIKKYEDKRTGKPRYLVRYRTDQNRSTMKRGFGTLRDATAFLVEVGSAKADGSFVPTTAGRVTIEELGAPWLAHKQAVTSKTYGGTPSRDRGRPTYGPDRARWPSPRSGRAR